MKNFALIVGVVTITVIVGGVFLSTRKDEALSHPLPSGYEYFWGDGCPHCANVEAFFESWEGRDAVEINKMEVWKNAKNASLMRERALYCKLDLKNLGVPLLFTPDGKCMVGDQPIIEYFKSLAL